jgi:hypothetical protein
MTAGTGDWCLKSIFTAKRFSAITRFYLLSDLARLNKVFGKFLMAMRGDLAADFPRFVFP